MPTTPSPTPRRNSAGLIRDLELLELLSSRAAAEQGGFGVSQLAQLTGRDKGAISRALSTLADAGLVDRDVEKLSYRLGARIYSMAAFTAEAALVREARLQLRRIAHATRETTHLCVLRGGNVLTLLSELSPYQFHTTSWEGVTTAAWRTPSGRVLISDLDREAIAQWYTEHGRDAPILSVDAPASTFSTFTISEEPPETTARVTDLASLLAEINRIRRAGFAISDEELERGVVAVSAPVFDFTHRIVAAVNVSAPKARLEGQVERLAHYVADAAHNLSRSLGWQGEERLRFASKRPGHNPYAETNSE